MIITNLHSHKNPVFDGHSERDVHPIDIDPFRKGEVDVTKIILISFYFVTYFICLIVDMFKENII